MAEGEETRVTDRFRGLHNNTVFFPHPPPPPKPFPWLMHVKMQTRCHPSQICHEVGGF